MNYESEELPQVRCVAASRVGGHPWVEDTSRALRDCGCRPGQFNRARKSNDSKTIAIINSRHQSDGAADARRGELAVHILS